ncbi:MAG: hypothetical protein KDD43_08255, partial [Bdellovibrionales bacterium]|nr:hypothetical protein [Bdellovibrionales bacterium]
RDILKTIYSIEGWNRAMIQNLLGQGASQRYIIAVAKEQLESYRIEDFDIDPTPIEHQSLDPNSPGIYRVEHGITLSYSKRGVTGRYAPQETITRTVTLFKESIEGKPSLTGQWYVVPFQIEEPTPENIS